jgi:hypothetical protein
MKKIYSLFMLSLCSIGAMAQLTCAEAQVVTLGATSVPGVTGTQLPSTFCVGAIGGTDAAMWYSFTPETDMGITVSSAVSAIDTRMHIYTGICENLQCVGGDDDSGPGYSSIASINVTAGTEYFIVWDNYWTGNAFTFNITESVFVEQLVNFTSINGGTSAMAVLDMNGDYLDDLVGTSGDNLNIGYQQTDGSFSNTTVPISGGVQHSPSWSICGGDLDGNGRNDLLFAGGGGASFIWANADGSAYNETSDNNYIFCQRSNLVDINMDGQLDAFVCHDIAPNVWYINNGTQLFEHNQGGLGDTPDGGNYGSVWIDYDNDCDMDMFIAKCRGGQGPANINQMHRNNGDGTFTEVGAEIGLADNVQTWSSAWADFDNDGDMDVVVGASSSINGNHKVMRNNGDGTFTDITVGSGFDTFPSNGIEWAPADFNNDGLVDVIGAGSTIMVNLGDFTFGQNAVTFGVGPMGDLNNDGFLDVVAGSTIHLGVPNENNFLVINTIGTESNKNGIGARVTVESPSFTQIRDVRSGEGFRYMSTLNTHFGLGTDETITKVTVCWPSGITDEILNPNINETLVITEGESVSNVAENTVAELNIYPNPATDRLTIAGNEWNKANVIVTDLSGKTVLNTTLIQNELNIAALESGFYIIRLELNGNHSEQKFVKK